jgi:hypothetical protein
MTRCVAYTAVFGDYDHIPAVNPKWDCDFICFTDKPELVSRGWQVVLVQLNGEQPAQANRRYKMHPHKYLPNYERSLYVDGNIEIVADPSPLFEKYLANAVIAIPKHQDRICTYAEAHLCMAGGLVSRELTEKQMARYEADGFPLNFGLNENNVIFRSHNDRDVVTLMESWWDEYYTGGRRDQLSLPYLIWKYNFHVLEVIEGPRISTKFFKINLHAADKSKPFFKRMAKEVNIKKHLSCHYLIMSVFVSQVVSVRDKFRIKIRKS